MSGKSWSYSSVLNGSFNCLPRHGIQSDVPRAVDHAVELHGLGELGEGLGSLVGEYDFDSRHGKMMGVATGDFRRLLVYVHRSAAYVLTRLQGVRIGDVGNPSKYRRVLVSERL